MKKNGSSQTPEILLLSNSLTFWEPCWTILPELTRRYGKFSPRMNDKTLARVFKEHLCRIGRFRI